MTKLDYVKIDPEWVEYCFAHKNTKTMFLVGSVCFEMTTLHKTVWTRTHFGWKKFYLESKYNADIGLSV